MLKRLLINIFNFHCCEDDLKRIEHLLMRSNSLQEEQIHYLRKIYKALIPHNYQVIVKGDIMAIPVGGTGTFLAELQDNGTTITNSNPWTWTADDPVAILTPSGDTCVVEIPSTDVHINISVTATTTDPNGNTVSGFVTVDITPGTPHRFTVKVSQTA